jgi:hypothetical protein
MISTQTITRSSRTPIAMVKLVIASPPATCRDFQRMIGYPYAMKFGSVATLQEWSDLSFPIARAWPERRLRQRLEVATTLRPRNLAPIAIAAPTNQRQLASGL